MSMGSGKAALALGLVLALAACGDRVRTHGFVPSDADLEAVVVGRDTRTTVATILGPPGGTGIVADEGWYYVRSIYDGGTYRAQQEVDREVVAVSFDDAGVVTNVERFGLEDGQVVALSRRVTDDNTRGVGFLRQLFGNLGRIDPSQFFN
jgi:outer membrane protein assembly factor BamE (lipoprotein component of BamABCDE complex)